MSDRLYDAEQLLLFNARQVAQAHASKRALRAVSICGPDDDQAQVYKLVYRMVYREQLGELMKIDPYHLADHFKVTLKGDLV